MKLVLLFMYFFFITSCKEDKIIYIEKDVQLITPEGKWDIEGFWYKKVHYKPIFSVPESIVTYDTLESANDIIELYFDYTTEEYHDNKSIFKCRDTSYQLNMNARYPFVIFTALNSIRESFTFFNHYFDYEGFVNTSPDFYLKIGLKHKSNEGVAPFVADNENCFINISIGDQITKNGSTTYSTYHFQATGKRLK